MLRLPYLYSRLISTRPPGVVCIRLFGEMCICEHVAVYADKAPT